jgi:hypothetical protein
LTAIAQQFAEMGHPLLERSVKIGAHHVRIPGREKTAFGAAPRRIEAVQKNTLYHSSFYLD